MEVGKKKGKLYVISGPSGAGKGTITTRILNEMDMGYSVSMTTRAPRTGEIEGVHYFFSTKEQFEKMIADDGFLEHAERYGNYYGSPKAPVLEKLAKGQDVILEIEMQGAMQVKKNYPDGVFIFVLPPSLPILRQRLIDRKTETPESIELRLSSTLDEMRYIEDYDYFVVNDDLEEAVARVKAIITAEHSKVNITADEIVKKYKEEA